MLRTIPVYAMSLSLEYVPPEPGVSSCMPRRKNPPFHLKDSRRKKEQEEPDWHPLSLRRPIGTSPMTGILATSRVHPQARGESRVRAPPKVALCPSK